MHTKHTFKTKTLVTFIISFCTTTHLSLLWLIQFTIWQDLQTEMLCKRSGKEVKIREFVYRDKTNVEPEMYDCTSNNWSHCNCNEKLKEKLGSYTRKTFYRFNTKDSYTWNITHNKGSTAVWSLKPERWGSPMVQEKYQEGKACYKRHPYRIIIIIIIIIIIKRKLGYNCTKTLLRTCAKISRNNSRRQGNHIVEPTNTNWQNYPQQQTRHYNPW